MEVKFYNTILLKNNCFQSVNSTTSQASYLSSFVTDGSSQTDRLILGSVHSAAILLVSAILVLEVYYICKYKTSFILRLFLYFSISGFLSIVSNAAVYLYVNVSWNDTSIQTNQSCDLIISAAIFYQCFRALELSFILCINFAFLRKVYKYILGGTHLVAKRPQHQRFKEVLFVFCLVLFVFGIGVPELFIGLSLHVHNLHIYHLFLLIAICSVSSCIALVLLIVWIYRLKRSNLLQKRSMDVYEVVGFFIVVLFSFVVIGVFSFLILMLQLYSLIKPLTSDVIISMLDVCLCSPFLFYVCLSLRKAQKQRRVVRDYGTIESATNPVSDRVSLPSNTVDNAIKFLSPSTDSPTDQTGLVN